MRVDRLETLKKILLRAKKKNNNKFNIEYFQCISHGVKPDFALESEEELHACGYSACVGGYLAVSPEWRKFGGTVSSIGSPSYHELNTINSMKEWLEYETYYERELIECLFYLNEDSEIQYEKICGKTFKSSTDIKIDDAITFIDYLIWSEQQ